MRTRTWLFGLLAAPLMIAQCAPACTPARPMPPPRTTPPRPPVALFGCVDGADVHWWFNLSAASPEGRAQLDGDRVTVTVDGEPFIDPLPLGTYPMLVHYDGALTTTFGVDVDVSVSDPNGRVELRADNLRACPVATVHLSGATIDCSGTLSLRTVVTVDGGQFQPPPFARITLVAQLFDSITGQVLQSRQLLDLNDPATSRFPNGHEQTFTATGLDPRAGWTVWGQARAMALNGVDGSPGWLSGWPPITESETPVEATC